MHSNILALGAFLTAVGLGEAALAASQTTGTIQRLDDQAKTVTLIEGPTFHLPVGYDLTPFHIGEKVRLNWEEKGALKEALGMVAL